MDKVWIQRALRGRGPSFHKQLGLAEDAEITLDVLEEAAKRDDLLGRRARLALLLRGHTLVEQEDKHGNKTLDQRGNPKARRVAQELTDQEGA